MYHPAAAVVTHSEYQLRPTYMGDHTTCFNYSSGLECFLLLGRINFYRVQWAC